tara:strand:- start:269 stop:631 length:363 start_codon:yes stop_codon:yes gene_type:complete
VTREIDEDRVHLREGKKQEERRKEERRKEGKKIGEEQKRKRRERIRENKEQVRKEKHTVRGQQNKLTDYRGPCTCTRPRQKNTKIIIKKQKNKNIPLTDPRSSPGTKSRPLGVGAVCPSA